MIKLHLIDISSLEIFRWSFLYSNSPKYCGLYLLSRFSDICSRKTLYQKLLCHATCFVLCSSSIWKKMNRTEKYYKIKKLPLNILSSEVSNMNQKKGSGSGSKQETSLLIISNRPLYQGPHREENKKSGLERLFFHA